jgi:outer membrane protein assembly factor BamB
MKSAKSKLENAKLIYKQYLEKIMPIIKKYKFFRNIGLYYTIFILHFTFCILQFTFCLLPFAFISCSHFKIKDQTKNIHISQQSLFSPDTNYHQNTYCTQELLPPLIEKWQKKYESTANRGFTFFQELLLYTDSKGKIQFIRAADGQQVGSYKLKGIGANPPTIYQNIIYQSCETGKYGLIVYDLTSGRRLWYIKKKLSRSSPIVHDYKVFHQTLAGELFCCNYYSGEEIWHLSLTSAVYNSLALKDNILYCATLNGKITAIENSGGIIVWQQNLDQSVLANPVIHDNILFITGYNGTLYLLELKTGKILHEIKLNTPMYHGPSIDAQNIYLTLSNGKAIAVSKSTHMQIWEYSGDGPTAGSPLITNSYLYYTTLAKKLYILDKTDGKLLQVIELKERARSTPVIYHDTLIIACEDKHIIAFETTTDNP